MKQLQAKHPLAVRWLHWINFPLMMILTWSGILLYVENNNFRIGVGTFTLFHFFPQGFYDALHLRDRNNEGLAWHLLFMWFFAVNGVLYTVYTIVSGEWRYLLPRRNDWGKALQVVLHDLYLSRVLPSKGKYNAAQKIAYSAVLVMGILMITTGFALWKPDQLGWLGVPFGGAANTKAVHFWLTILFVAYFVIHVAQVVRAGWGNFCSMITGYEVVPVGAVPITSDEPPLPRTKPVPSAEAEKEMYGRSRRSLLYSGLAALLALGLWGFLASLSHEEGVPQFLREMVTRYNGAEHDEEKARDKGDAEREGRRQIAEPDRDRDRVTPNDLNKSGSKTP